MTPEDTPPGNTTGNGDGTAQNTGGTANGQPPLNAEGGNTGAPGDPGKREPQPLYTRTPFWLILGMLIGVLLMLLLTRCQPPVQQVVTLRQDLVSPQELLDVQRAYTRSLEEELRRLEEAMRQDPCKIPEFLGTSPETTPFSPNALPGKAGTTPPSAAGNGTRGLPGTGTSTQGLPKAGNGTLQPMQAPPPSTVGELMEQATVLILASTPDGVSFGTGFFVAPGIIATNRHVVHSKSAEILVGNKILGGMHEATVLAISDDPARDYALIKLPIAVGVAPTLSIADKASRTEHISSWGFPGLITAADPKFNALLEGDPSAVPEVVYSEGVVSAVLDRTPPFIMHTAQISQGNSGGPLINSQGTVLGINTLIRTSDQSSAQANIALPGGDLKLFMRENGVTPTAPGI